MALLYRPDLIVDSRPARTLAKEVGCEGVGLHTGHFVKMKFCPAVEGTGLQFRRTDLPGTPLIPVSYPFVRSTHRATTIGVGQACVHTVEHVLAALRAFQIDNLTIELSEAEPPVAGGNASQFVEMIQSVGWVEQSQKRPILRLDRPFFYSSRDVHLVALPSEEVRISYTLYYPQSPALLSQYFSIALDCDSFIKELALCRSFALYEEVSPLLDAGLIKGTSLDSGIVVKGDAILSKDGLHFPDEMVRHKVLDAVGDFALLGVDVQMHLIGIRAGHTSNAALGRQIDEYLKVER